MSSKTPREILDEFDNEVRILQTRLEAKYPIIFDREGGLVYFVDEEDTAFERLALETSRDGYHFKTGEPLVDVLDRWVNGRQVYPREWVLLLLKRVMEKQ